MKVGNYCTDTFSSCRGVRQGDNLSPILFNIFIYDIPSYFDSSCDAVCLTKEHINCLLYADDLVLLSNSEKGLQNCIEKLSTFCNDWGMNVNLDKTKTLMWSLYKKKRCTH